jgi:putative colanic acid biosynthesis glycosyltransferase
MKLLQINTSLNTSSTGKIVSQIAKMCTDNGDESYIAFSGRYPANKYIKNTLRIGSKLDFYWHAFITRIFDRHGFGSIRATKKLIKKIDYIKPDIIHLHNLHGYYINIENLFNYLAFSKIPIVWTMHDCWPLTGHCSHFEYIKCKKWEKACYSCPQSSSYPSSLLVDNSKENFLNKKRLFNSVRNMTIVPVSNWLDNQIKYSYLNGFKSRVIQNGIDLEVFKPSKSGAFIKDYNLHNKFIILGVASVWTERKGFFEFIKLRELLGEDFAIVLVGVNKKLQKMLPINIISTTRISDQAELAMIYSCADLYLNLTFEDTYPSTNLESIACGTQVLTYKTGGSPESIIEEGGYVVNQGDIKVVKNLIEDMRNGALPRISKNTLVDIAHKRFNKDNNFIHYIKLYREILGISV